MATKTKTTKTTKTVKSQAIKRVAPSPVGAKHGEAVGAAAKAVTSTAQSAARGTTNYMRSFFGGLKAGFAGA